MKTGVGDPVGPIGPALRFAYSLIRSVSGNVRQSIQQQMHHSAAIVDKYPKATDQILKIYPDKNTQTARQAGYVALRRRAVRTANLHHAGLPDVTTSEQMQWYRRQRAKSKDY